MRSRIIILLSITFFSFKRNSKANFITATPVNYTSFINGLLPGDSLYLTAGSYTNQLNLNNLNGTSITPIVIMGVGNATVFLANAYCNTVNITNCSYLVIKNFKIDGQNINYVDGVKAGGGAKLFYSSYHTEKSFYH